MDQVMDDGQVDREMGGMKLTGESMN